MTSLNKGDSIYGLYDVGIFGSVGGQRWNQVYMTSVSDAGISYFKDLVIILFY